jgi:small subunit ribosomal protein S13
LEIIYQIKKKIYIALTQIYGIGVSKALKILKKLEINSNKKVANLNEKEISTLRDTLEFEIVNFEGNLKRQIALNIKHLIDINCIRGKRHLKGLPVRGQRTRTNSRTARRKNIFIRVK